MTPETLRALKGSIVKWQEIVARKRENQGPLDCPLCTLFNDPFRPDQCVGCPVWLKTGERGCVGSPYDEYASINPEDYRNEEGDLNKEALTAEEDRLAQAELDFLISLLPEGEVP